VECLLLALSCCDHRSAGHDKFRRYCGPNVVLESPCRSRGLKAVWPSGSRHSTINAMSHRMACTESTPEPIGSTTAGSVRPRPRSGSLGRPGSGNRLIVSYRGDASAGADLRRRSRNAGMSSRSGGARVGDDAAVSFGGSDAESGTKEGDGAVSSSGALRLAVASAGGVGGCTFCPFAASGRARLRASLLIGTPLCSPFLLSPSPESETSKQSLWL
jgi:hypothetical protein